MDTTKLEVGQKVWMRSGDLRREIVVTEITDTYIQVEPVFAPLSKRPWMALFDKSGWMLPPFYGTGGRGCFGFYEWYEALGWWQEEPRFDPWELTSEASVVRVYSEDYSAPI